MVPINKITFEMDHFLCINNDWTLLLAFQVLTFLMLFRDNFVIWIKMLPKYLSGEKTFEMDRFHCTCNAWVLLLFRCFWDIMGFMGNFSFGGKNYLQTHISDHFYASDQQKLPEKLTNFNVLAMTEVDNLFPERTLRVNVLSGDFSV